MTAHVEVWRVMVATWIGLACWLALSIPACLIFGRVCGMHQRCRYVDDDPTITQADVDAVAGDFDAIARDLADVARSLGLRFQVDDLTREYREEVDDGQA